MISGTLNSAPVAQLPAITSVQQQILVIKMQHNVRQEITGRKKKNQSPQRMWMQCKSELEKSELLGLCLKYPGRR